VLLLSNVTGKFIIENSGAFARGAKFKSSLKSAHEALDSQIIKNTTPFVPFRTGMLSSSPIRAKTKTGEIVYKTPYARRLYYGESFNFNKTFHPQATAKWLEKAKAIWYRQWVNVVAKILKGGSK